MTNLAVALMLDPSIAKKIAKIISLSGTTQTTGNITSFGEFNIVTDPEAA